MMSKLFILLCSLLLTTVSYAQFQKVPADQVSVVDTNFTHIVGTNAQEAFDSIDTQLGNSGAVTNWSQYVATTNVDINNKKLDNVKEINLGGVSITNWPIASQITNDSSVMGVNVKDALETINSNLFNEVTRAELAESGLQSNMDLKTTLTEVKADADISDALSKKHTQNSDLYLNTPVGNILYVDNKRSDAYTENGSITKPFKTIQAANDAISGNNTTNKFVIKIATGNYYSESLTLNKDQVVLEGYGATRLTGNITITSPHIRFVNLRITSPVTLSLTTGFLLEVMDCSVSSGDWNITATAPVGNEFLQITGDSTIWTAKLNVAGIKGLVGMLGGVYAGTQNITNCNVEFGNCDFQGVINLDTGTVATVGAVLPISATVNLKAGATLNADATLLGSGLTLNNTGGTLNYTTKASGITNNSSVVGTTVKDALNTLKAGTLLITENGNTSILWHVTSGGWTNLIGSFHSEH